MMSLMTHCMMCIESWSSHEGLPSKASMSWINFGGWLDYRTCIAEITRSKKDMQERALFLGDPEIICIMDRAWFVCVDVCLLPTPLRRRSGMRDARGFVGVFSLQRRQSSRLASSKHGRNLRLGCFLWLWLING